MPLCYPDFREASADEFRTKYRNFAPLLNRADIRLWPALNNAAAFSHMRSATVCWGYPAVAGITFLVAPLLGSVPDEEVDYVKKGIGAIVCAIMESNGFEKTGIKKSVPRYPYRVFSRGEVYRSSSPALNATS